MCNYDFTILKSDEDVQHILRESKIYIIAQRPVISFENIKPDKTNTAITFEIHQKGNPNILTCSLPFFQPAIAKNEQLEILLYMGSNDPENKIISPPFNNIHGIKFLETDGKEIDFLIWFTPEKLLQNYWKGLIKCKIEGDIKDFLNYSVHYVGKATEQDIWKRLSGHNTLQDILSLEYPFTYGDLPTHEICLLFLKFKGNIEFQSFGPNSDMNAFNGNQTAEQRTIFLDAEKALVKSMQPKYNKELFKNYPKSTDGLFKDNFDAISYTFIDPIKLVYDEGTIEGGLTPIGGDMILIKDNLTVELLKHKR